MTDAPFSEYAARNTGPILKVLRDEFAAVSSLLEIGSGTGQHAVSMAAAMPHLVWQTSDLDENHAGILARLADARLDNLRAPLSLDVQSARLAGQHYDAVFSANTAHIMSLTGVEKMFRLVGDIVPSGGVFCLYGPFRQNGAFNTASNEAFHQSLQSRDARMGIRDIEELDGFATAAGLRRVRLYAMPANNHLAVWQKEAA
tara:strand:- start:4368 stop:4970 length:603 start_codon:yes stop_codon:yes gene_type:complete